jgi:putative two-component system response regulator
MTASFNPRGLADPGLTTHRGHRQGTFDPAVNPGRIDPTFESADARILIVDDEPANVALLRQVLAKNGYHNLRTLSDSGAVIDVIKEWDPNLILLDLHMPNIDGMTLLVDIRTRLAMPEISIVVITADSTVAARTAALGAGASDFLLKPIDVVEVTLRVRNLLRIQRLHLQLTDQMGLLEKRVEARTAELAASQKEILERLARAGEYRDDTTGRHTQRVGALSVSLATELGLPADEIEHIKFATPLHDIGKIAIPDRILLKPGPLTAAEYDQVKLHVTVGAAILAGGVSPILQMAEQVALHHHERWDGSGYLGIAGLGIPRAARIVAVADVYDALISARPYKQAWPTDKAAAEIIALSGSHFDPEVVEAFRLTVATTT